MFTHEQVEALHAPLSRSKVHTREGAGRATFSYITAYTAIEEANNIFGFENWHRETLEMRLVSERETSAGKFSVAYISRVRITVDADGKEVIRDGTGCGTGLDSDCGKAHESACKEAESDAMKRALMTFGNPFGLALYDKAQTNVEKPAAAQRQVQAPQPKQEAPMNEWQVNQIKTLCATGEIVYKPDDVAMHYCNVARAKDLTAAQAGIVIVNLTQKRKEEANAQKEEAA